jgi:2-dehydro-3-deoxyphosphogluconate aldolase / (4S)-4-hydroxy-2-oxoglutarate aldolase
MSTIPELLRASRVMPVITIDNPELAVPVAKALLEAGLPIMELMLRTPKSLEALRNITRALPSMKVGAGTVLNAEQMRQAEEAGASFTVSPGATPALYAAAGKSRLPYLPAVSSASELMLAMEHGHAHCKLFPAAVLGSKLAGALNGPFPEARFCATGGISRTNLREFLSQPNVLTVGCSWLATPELIAGANWRQIHSNAEEACALADNVRGVCF